MGVTCPNCGREPEGPESFCDSCGAFLGWDAGQPTDSQVFPPQAPQRGGDQRAGVQIQIDDDLIEVTPGNAESTAFTIKNFGTKVEEFRLLLSGPEWLVVEPATMTVYPGQDATGTIQAAPPREPGSVAGVAPFRLTVTSALHAHVSSSDSGRVEVAPFYELAAELVPTSSSGRGVTRHRLTLDNRGNVPLRVALTPADVADGLRLSVPGAADVPRGQVVEVPVSVYGSRRWVGRPERKAFSIVAEPSRPLAPTRLPGTRTVVPVFPVWVPVAAAGLAVVAVAAAAVIPKLAAHHGPAQSQPSSTQLSPTTQPSPTQPSPTQPSPTQPSPTQPSPTQPSPTQPAGLAISGVSFNLGPTAPIVTITGQGFGATAPAGMSDNTTPCGGYSSNGDDYGTSNLKFVDTGNFSAGGGIPPNGDCIGLAVLSWSTNQVVFQFGNAYHTFAHGYVTVGDQYTVWVNNVQYTGTVS